MSGRMDSVYVRDFSLVILVKEFFIDFLFKFKVSLFID